MATVWYNTTLRNETRDIEIEFVDYLMANTFLQRKTFNLPSFYTFDSFKVVRLAVALFGFVASFIFVLANIWVPRKKFHSIFKIRTYTLFLGVLLLIMSGLFGIIFALDLLWLNKATPISDDHWRIVSNFVLIPFFQLYSLLLMSLSVDRYASLFYHYHHIIKKFKAFLMVLIPTLAAFVFWNPFWPRIILPKTIFLTYRIGLTFLPDLWSVIMIIANCVVRNTVGIRNRFEKPPERSYSGPFSKVLAFLVFINIICNISNSITLIANKPEYANMTIVKLNEYYGVQFVIWTFLLLPFVVVLLISIFIEKYKHVMRMFFHCKKNVVAPFALQ